MAANHDHEDIASISSRLTKVEAAVSHIDAAIQKLAKGFEVLQQNQSDARRPNYGVLIASVSLIVASGGGLWALAIRPLEDRITTSASRVNSIADRTEDMEQALVRADERGKVLRVEMMSQASIANIRANYDHLFRQMLWKKAFGDDMPPIDYWPGVTQSTETMSIAGNPGSNR